MPEAMMGVLRLLGAMAGIAVMLVLLIVAIWTAMWAVLLVVRHVPMVGRRYLATKPTR
jgi:cell division septal protein FtsQ